MLLDIKPFDPAIARKVTGRGIAPTLTFARRLAARRQPVWVRFVLVPGWTDDPGNVAALAQFTASLGNVERVDVLPFHTLGTPKYAALGLDYPLRRRDPAGREADRPGARGVHRGWPERRLTGASGPAPAGRIPYRRPAASRTAGRPHRMP